MPNCKMPLLIAHRGASGYLPEHSLAAKALAFGQGADYLEQDVVASRDGELLVLHDPWLENVSDVANRFPGRARPDGHYYCLDFDLAEIRQLQFGERINPETGTEYFPGRFKRNAAVFQVNTLAEEIRFIESLNKSAGRNVGIYPEIKDPEWHLEQGVDLTALVISELDEFGYLEAGSRMYLQCFDAETLKRVRKQVGTQVQLVQLLGSSVPVDDAMLSSIASYANAIGPSIKLIYKGQDASGQRVLTNLVSRAHELKLKVHPYTFRADALPDGINNFDDLLTLFINQQCVDGLFTDFTDLVAEYIQAQPST
ncbi:MAG: glycerophosphodiester phosphodiesterase [Gammaproteobacteria bacterium]|nr:glycerophosphodiester phosphodiesterase [Gammaproteobacteria bacterium]